MAQVLVYDATTGSIKRRVTCPAAFVADQVKSGEAQIAVPEGFTGNDTTHVIVDGEVATIE